jgi:hypothetical protein
MDGLGLHRDASSVEARMAALGFCSLILTPSLQSHEESRYEIVVFVQERGIDSF